MATYFDDFSLHVEYRKDYRHNMCDYQVAQRSNRKKSNSQVRCTPDVKDLLKYYDKVTVQFFKKRKK